MFDKLRRKLGWKQCDWCKRWDKHLGGFVDPRATPMKGLHLCWRCGQTLVMTSPLPSPFTSEDFQ